MRNDYLNNLSLALQIISLEILFKDFNNSDLMQELQNQDTNYLEKIIKQNERIIELLERSDSNGRNDKKTMWIYWRSWAK